MCGQHPVWRERGKKRVDLCKTPELFLAGAKEIRDRVAH
jgi:hypothetical protein